MSRVSFYFLDKSFSFKNRNELKNYVGKIFAVNKRQLAHLSYIFCSDEYLLNINRQFLQHDYYTDIITFDMSLNKKEITGEVYISVDRIRENAKIHHQTLKHELHRVIFHGALHLCGYKDKTERERKIMRKCEDRCLSEYFAL
jgi:rRNA maturation RNase YbeY